jgi:hypothetical protein
MPPKAHLKEHEWQALTEMVFRRDLREAWVRQDRLRAKMPLSQVPAKEACVARFLDPNESATCWGRITFNHVHERGKQGMQMKAPDDEFHLVSLCEGHHGFSRVSGGWANYAASIELERKYLEEIYAPGSFYARTIYP